MPLMRTPPAIAITYVGGPTTIIEVAGLRFLTDPTFDDPAPYKSGPVVLRKTEGPAVPAVGDRIDPSGALRAELW